LERELGGEGLRADSASLRPFAIGPLLPRAVAFPSSPEQTAAVLAHANEAGWAVVPWGGGTRVRDGAAPARYDLALSFARLASVLEHDVDNLTLTAQAGATLLAAALRVKSQRQMIAAGWPWERRSLGGLIASNRGVPKRLAYGALRDQLLGLRVALPDGKLVRFGGKVLKNVAGYDLTKFFIGSLGTGAVIVESTWKLFALPDEEGSLAMAFPSVEAAASYCARMLRTPLLPAFLYVLDSRAAARVIDGERSAGLRGAALAWVGFDGRSAAVRRQIADARAFAESSGGSWVASGGRPSEAAAGYLLGETELDSHPIRVRLGCAPSRTGAWCVQAGSGLEARGLVGEACADYPAGRITFRVSASANRLEFVVDWLRSLRRDLAAEGGFAAIESGSEELRERAGAWGDLGAAGRLMARLRAELDPRETLSPGRLGIL
jgi:glycolate oxidase FAD binding subunit